ncbi:MAG: redoxin domain-containing protein [Myxococcales bacterium]|nr:redoxin domain-containing protein [Myxococcales bacterium]
MRTMTLILALALAGCAGTTTGPANGQTASDTDATDDAGTALDGGTAKDGTAAASDAAATGSDAAGGSDTAAADTAAVDAGTGSTDVGQADTGAQDAGTAVDAGQTNGKGWGPEKCQKAGSGTGFGIGQQLGSLSLKDCDTGKSRAITEVCGAKATWLFVAHSHCPTCQATASYTKQVALDLADKDIAIVHVIQIDDGQTCQGWRKKYGLTGLPNVKFYTENTGKAWQAIKTKNYTAPHAIMKADRVITFKAHGLSSGAVKQKLQQALAAN